MDDALDLFMRYTDGMPTTERYRRWCGIGLVSSLLSRRVWTSLDGGERKIFANMYIMLVGEPADGKSVAIDAVNGFVVPHLSVRDKRKREAVAGSVDMGPDSVTREEMLDWLGDVFSDGWEEGMFSAMLTNDEFATLGVDKQSDKWLQELAKIWDNPSKPYKYWTKHSGDAELYGSYLTILAGAQPAWFAEGLPAQSWRKGFPARTLFIWGDPTEMPRVEWFKRPAHAVKARADLADALTQTVKVWGFWDWSDAAKDRWIALADTGFAPAPDNPLLAHYAKRRRLHLAKLALVCAVSAHPHRQKIDVEDLDRAFGWLIEAERKMPLAVRGAGGNPYKLRMEEVIEMVTAAPGEVPEAEVREALSHTVPLNMVGPIIDELVAQGRLIDTTGAGVEGKRRFVVRARRKRHTADGDET